MDALLALILVVVGVLAGGLIVGLLVYLFGVRPRMEIGTALQPHALEGEEWRAAIAEQNAFLARLAQLVIDQTEQPGGPPIEWQRSDEEIRDVLALQRRAISRLNRTLREENTSLRSMTFQMQKSESALREIEKQLDRNTQLLQKTRRKVGTIADDPDFGADSMEYDRLTDIKGIGAGYAAKLYEAGIFTFAQFANMTPEELRLLLGVPKWRSTDAPEWIKQAAVLSGQRTKSGDDLPGA